jgi:hypothetical protein
MLCVPCVATKRLSHINNKDAEFAYGASQIDPIKALSPASIYDAEEIHYIIFYMDKDTTTRKQFCN